MSPATEVARSGLVARSRRRASFSRAARLRVNLGRSEPLGRSRGGAEPSIVGKADTVLSASASTSSIDSEASAELSSGRLATIVSFSSILSLAISVTKIEVSRLKRKALCRKMKLTMKNAANHCGQSTQRHTREA